MGSRSLGPLSETQRIAVGFNGNDWNLCVVAGESRTYDAP